MLLPPLEVTPELLIQAVVVPVIIEMDSATLPINHSAPKPVVHTPQEDRPALRDLCSE
jgi:hypothetical protein